MRFSILGPLLVRDEAGAAVAVGGARLRTLLALLLLAPGRWVSTDFLVDSLWAGSPPAAAGNALQALVSRLRRVLGAAAAVEGGPSGYRLAVDPGQVDLTEFEGLARSGRRLLDEGRYAESVLALDGAAALWRGPALPELTSQGLAEGVALRLADTFRGVVEDRPAALVGAGRYGEALPEAEALARDEPLRERPAEILMLALAGTGRSADAVGVYEDVRARLAGELGLDPSPRLAAAHARVLRGELSPAPPAAAPAPAAPRLRLPVALTGFVPREEVSVAAGLLTDGRLVTLLGPGGSGKTRLAVEAVAELARREPGLLSRGAWFVDLSPLEPGADVAEAVADTLGLRERHLVHGPAPARTAPAADRVASFTADHAVLLVLDNCEHLVGDAARLTADLLARCPNLRVLGTSREPLGVPGEQLLPVPPLAMPPEGAGAEEARSYPSVALFAERARAVRPGFEVTEDNAAHVGRAVRALDGMPLALELAAARLRAMTPAQLADRLGDRFRLLGSGVREARPRHSTLRAVVDWSWELLDEAERRTLRRLSVFSGRASLESVEQVCADPGSGGEVAGRDVWPVLFSLVDKSLVVVEDTARSDGPPRYRLLETVRAYAAERLEEAGEQERVRDAHACRVRDLWRECDPLLRGPRQAELLESLHAEEDNLASAVRWALLRGDTGTALDLVEHSQWYWTLRGAAAQLGRWSDEVLAALDGRVPEGRGAAVAGCVFHSGVVRGSAPGGEPFPGDRVEAVAEKAGVRLEEHPVLVSALVHRAILEGRGGPARKRLEQAREQGDPWMRAAVRLMLSVLDMLSGRIADSEGPAETALAEFRALGDTWGECQALAQLVDARRFGDLEACRRLLDEGVARAEDRGLRGTAVELRIRRLQVLVDLGDLPAAGRELAGLDGEMPSEGHDFLVALARVHYLCESGRIGEARREVARVQRAAAAVGGYMPGHGESVWCSAAAAVEWYAGNTPAALREAVRAWRLSAGAPALVHAELLDLVSAICAEEDPESSAALSGHARSLRGVPDTVTPFVVRGTERARGALGAHEYDRIADSAAATAPEAVGERVEERLRTLIRAADDPAGRP